MTRNQFDQLCDDCTHAALEPMPHELVAALTSEDLFSLNAAITAWLSDHIMPPFDREPAKAEG